MIYPILRLNRAIACTLLIPEHPIYAVAISEIGSVILPFMNILNYRKFIVLTIAIMYAPNFANAIISLNNMNNYSYQEKEILLLLFFIISISFSKLIFS